jgi:hypothetical protein
VQPDRVLERQERVLNSGQWAVLGGQDRRTRSGVAVRARRFGFAAHCLLPTAHPRQGQEPRQHAGHLDDRVHRVGVVRAVQEHREVERLVLQVRERVRRVGGQRREDREDLAAEQVADVRPVGVGELIDGAQHDPAGCQRRQHFLLEDAVLVGHQLAGDRPDALELRLRRHLVGPGPDRQVGRAPSAARCPPGPCRTRPGCC